MVHQTILANARRIGLIDACRFFFRIDPINCFAARGIQRIVNECVRTLVGPLFSKRARTKDAIRIPVFGIKIKTLRVCDEGFETVGVFPFSICATVSRREQVVSDLVLEKFRPGAAFHCPVIPLPMQIVKIDNGRRSELYARDLIRRRTCARVVPWAND